MAVRSGAGTGVIVSLVVFVLTTVFLLVLGVEPPKPPPLPSDASPVLINDWVKRNEANERYNLVFRQAREAQIPVLNANRFFILIGYTER